MEKLTVFERFPDEESARKYLEELRWSDGIICPHCGVIDKHYAIKPKASSIRPARKGVYKCKDCRKQFTVTVGTIFERSHVPLHKWLIAVHLISSSKKGMSANQIHRLLGVTYKTAWFMCHRIREAMADPDFVADKLGGPDKIVEVDETYWGNKGKMKPKARGYEHTMKICSLVERDGFVKSFHIPRVTAGTLKPIIKEHIHKDTHLMTDEFGGYTSIGKEFANHSVVCHSKKEYSRGIASTNTVEGFFSLLKRGLVGTFHHVSEQHLQRYMDEFDFRYNMRKKNDDEIADRILQSIEGKRLCYYNEGQRKQ